MRLLVKQARECWLTTRLNILTGSPIVTVRLPAIIGCIALPSGREIQPFTEMPATLIVQSLTLPSSECKPDILPVPSIILE